MRLRRVAQDWDGDHPPDPPSVCVWRLVGVHIVSRGVHYVRLSMKYRNPTTGYDVAAEKLPRSKVRKRIKFHAASASERVVRKSF